jgi:predicted small metal-binding protein
LNTRCFSLVMNCEYRGQNPVQSEMLSRILQGVRTAAAAASLNAGKSVSEAKMRSVIQITSGCEAAD